MPEVWIVMWLRNGRYEVGSVHSTREGALEFAELVKEKFVVEPRYERYQVITRPLHRV